MESISKTLSFLILFINLIVFNRNKDVVRTSKPYGVRGTNYELKEVRNTSITGTQHRTRRQIDRKFIE